MESMESKDNSEAKEGGDETLKLASSSSSSLSELSEFESCFVADEEAGKGLGQEFFVRLCLLHVLL
jgi:hypothetical protein